MSSEKQVIPIIQSPPEKRRKERVAAYCRVSTQAEEQLHSLAAQREFYEKSSSDNSEVEFVGIYADEGISGTRTRNRTQFLALIQDCRDGKVDRILTKSVSRFGRNTVDTLIFTRELRSLGVDVYFEKENLHSISPEGELLLTLMAALAESESVSMSDNIKWGWQNMLMYGFQPKSRTSTGSLRRWNRTTFQRRISIVIISPARISTVRLIRKC